MDRSQNVPRNVVTGNAVDESATLFQSNHEGSDQVVADDKNGILASLTNGGVESHLAPPGGNQQSLPGDTSLLSDESVIIKNDDSLGENASKGPDVDLGKITTQHFFSQLQLEKLFDPQPPSGQKASSAGLDAGGSTPGSAARVGYAPSQSSSIATAAKTDATAASTGGTAWTGRINAQELSAHFHKHHPIQAARSEKSEPAHRSK